MLIEIFGRSLIGFFIGMMVSLEIYKRFKTGPHKYDGIVYLIVGGLIGLVVMNTL